MGNLYLLFQLKQQEKLIHYVKGEQSYANHEKSFRVVFDVDTSTGQPVCGYPIVFLTTSANKLLQRVTIPTEDMFLLVSLLVISYFKECTFSPTVEIAVSYALTYYLLLKVFPLVYVT